MTRQAATQAENRMQKLQERVAESFQVTVDRQALVLVALFSAVLAASLLVARPLLAAQGVSSAVDGTSTSTQTAAGAGWAIAETLVAIAILGLLALYRWLPEYLQSTVKATLKLALGMMIGALAIQMEAFLVVLAGIAAVVLAVKTTDHHNIYWLINNALALAAAIYFAAALGIQLGPWILGVGLIGLSVYDYAFADRSSKMFELGGFLVALRLPVLFIIPRGLQMEWSRLTTSSDELDGSGDNNLDDDVWFGIGTADLLLPAAFVVSLVDTTNASIAPDIVLAGAALGVLAACFRISRKLDTEGGGAGLPPLTSGALGGAILAAIVVQGVALLA